MDKRLLNFMLVSMLIFIGYMEILKLTRPPVEEKPGDEQVAEQVDGDAVNPIAPEGNAADTANALTSESNTPNNEAEANPSETNETGEVADGEVQFAVESKLVTIGSLDPAVAPMLVTINTRGAAIERVELSSPKYCDLEDKSAYIGHLGWKETPEGLTATVVGAGTPAALGGVQPGDVFTKIGEDPISNIASLKQALSKFKYGETLDVVVERGGTTQTLSLASIRRPLEVMRPEKMPNDVPGMQQLSYLMTLHQIGHKAADYGDVEIKGLPSLRNENWFVETVQRDGVAVVELRFPLTAAALKKIGLNGAVDVVKRYSLKPRSESEEDESAEHPYHFDFELEFVNKGTDNLELGYRLDGPTGLPLEGWWYSYKTHPKNFSGAGVRDVVWRAVGEGHKFHTNPVVTKRLKKEDETPELVFVDTDDPKRLQYLGVDAQYFTTAILASTAEDASSVVMNRIDARALSEIDEDRASKTPITFRADSGMVQVPAGGSAKYDFQIFAGPKHPDVLAEYGLGECIVYGWFSWPAKVMGWLLHKLYAVVRSYGIAIILLTVLVRACMLPIGRQQALNAKRMQELTPEIKKIKEKYPNDSEKQAKAQQELFRKHNYNPIAGCLPMFLQLPLFIGLYRALSVDIELRQTPLIPGLDWCANLAAPDMLYRWDTMIPFSALTGYTGYLGPFLNVLPMISTALFLVHQQMFTPPPTDEQQEMQQKVMKFMMLFMLVMFFKIPAGLCLYFITSSLWALGERMLLPKNDKKTENTPLSLSKAEPVAAGAGNGAGTAAAVAKKKRRKRNKK